MAVDLWGIGNSFESRPPGCFSSATLESLVLIAAWNRGLFEGCQGVRDQLLSNVRGRDGVEAS
jgi:hypothetical protein